MNILAILQEHAEEGAGGASSVFNLSTSVSFWTVVIFLILLFILSRYAFPPILGYAEAREKRIQAALDEARREREEAARLLEQQRAELAEGHRHAQQLIAEGKQAAERIRHELIERTRAEQEEIVARAKRDIEREREQAVEAVRREAVELAIAAAARLVEQRLTAEEDRRIVTEYLNRVDAGTRAGVA